MSDDDRTVISTRSRLSPGTRLNGIYEIERLMAVGGMGEVYHGRAIETGDPVAIKTIRPEMAQNEAAIGLFRREAAALHNLYHEAIVRYYVFTVDPESGSPYLAMEYVDGQSLSDRIKQGPLSLEEVDTLRRRVASGLHAAHQIGITHRDISPDNIILPGGNIARAKIIDFGIARSSQLGEATIIGGGFAGKYNYVSPEQLGLYGGDVTPKSDIYSLGLVLTEALAGKALDMGGTQMQILEKRRRVPDISTVDPRIRPLLARMLSPDPAGRPADMAEVSAWQMKPASSPSDRKLPFAAITGVAGVLLAGALAYMLWSAGTDGPGPLASDPPPALSGPGAEPPPPAATAEERPATAPGLAPVTSPQLAARTDPPAAEPRPAAIPTPTPPPPPPPVVTPPASTRTEPAPAPAASPIPPGVPQDRVSRYIASYDGGNCFALWPAVVNERRADLEGFGSSTEPFVAFDTAFKREIGFEAQIHLRPMTAAQCPLTGFLRQLGRSDPNLRLQLGSYAMKSGDTLSGTVEGYGDRNVDVLLVGDDGLVYSLASFVRREGARTSFGLRLQSTGGAARPQFIVAVASPRQIPLANNPKPLPATEFFPLLAQEAARSGGALGVNVKHFRID